MVVQGEELKATHKVQSHRGLIERMFARLKKWQILQNGNVDSILIREKELDAAMALLNLNERDRQGLMDSIPERAPCPPDAHIITKDLEPKLNIPTGITERDVRFPSHWKPFLSWAPSLLPELRLVLKGEGREAVFSARVRKRGENLFRGGNVAQFQLQNLPNDVYRINGWTHASMKAACYGWFVDLQQGDVLVHSACMCKNGYVSFMSWACFPRRALLSN